MADDTTIDFADELGGVAARLEKIAVDVTRPPVRLVKIVGDSVMLVSDDPATLVSAYFDLIAAAVAEGKEFPSLRVGIAQGSALNRSDDWYGRAVNLASRVVSVARPGSVLITRRPGPSRSISLGNNPHRPSTVMIRSRAIKPIFPARGLRSALPASSHSAELLVQGAALAGCPS